MTKRLLVLALLTLNFSLSLPIGSSHAFNAAHRLKTCRYESLDGHGGFNDYEIRQTMACAVTHWDVPGGFGTMLGVAQRESGMYPHAVNSYSGACGLYQHLPRYWPERFAAFHQTHPYYRLWPSCFAVRTQVMVTAWLMSHDMSPWN